MSDKGAHFYKCDLRANTQRDLNWTGVNCVTKMNPVVMASMVQPCRDAPRGILTYMRHAYYLAGQECPQNP
jgi:hypothetical protein